MKKLVPLLGGLLIFFSCGGGGGTSIDTKTYSLVEVSPGDTEVKSSTEVSRAVSDVIGVSETTSEVRSTGISKGLIPEIMNRFFPGTVSRGIVTFACDNGNPIQADVYYETTTNNPENCEDIQYVRIEIRNGYYPCQLGNLLIPENYPFDFIIEGSDLESNTCLPRKASVQLDGVTYVIDDAGNKDGAYLFDNLKVNYSNVVWSNGEIASATFTVTGSFAYYEPFPSYNTAISYSFDLSGTTTETGDTYAGWIKLGCMDGWFKIETSEPLKYSDSDIPYDGKMVITAKNGEVVVSYSASGIDITETVDNQTNTYHYNSFDKIKETVNGMVCMGE